MVIVDGKIVIEDSYDMDIFSEETEEYFIDLLIVELEEDNENLRDIYHCTGVTIQSDAPEDIIDKAEAKIYNILANYEFNGVDMDDLEKGIAECIDEDFGIEAGQIEIEYQ